jgi:hypothetical protein
LEAEGRRQRRKSRSKKKIGNRRKMKIREGSRRGRPYTPLPYSFSRSGSDSPS